MFCNVFYDRGSMKTKGTLLWELNSPFKVDEIDLGDPVADEVQIRVHAAGMCHSDYHLTTGATHRPARTRRPRGRGRRHQGR